MKSASLSVAVVSSCKGSESAIAGSGATVAGEKLSVWSGVGSPIGAAEALSARSGAGLDVGAVRATERFAPSAAAEAPEAGSACGTGCERDGTGCADWGWGGVSARRVTVP